MSSTPDTNIARVSVAELHEAIAALQPDKECLIFRDQRLTWSDVTERTRRLANYLIAQNLGCHTEREHLLGHESGQDHLAIYLHNGNEYLETMLGSFKARVAPFNVNYRYVAEELTYLLNDSQATAIVVHSQFAPILLEVLPNLPRLRVIIQVRDGSANELLPGAVWYEDALEQSLATKPDVVWSGDDLYILYTGGTTGMPKGVLWRNADALTECFGGSKTAASVEDFLAEATTGLRAIASPPFMHGAGHWVSFRIWNGGGTVIVQSTPERLDPHDIWSLIEREKVNFLLIVGDAFARPLLDGLASQSYDLSSLLSILSGGAPLSAHLKIEFHTHLPSVIVIDGLGSSEAGGQLAQVTAGGTATTGTFSLQEQNHILSENLERVLEPGHEELGWLAKSGRLALGYFGDPVKTARTYPVIDGVRYAVPGDRAKVTTDLMVELHGRDSVTINSGGEKIFAEEVEAAIKGHPSVYDCVVAGRPSDRWGNEVVAVVRIRQGHTPDTESLLSHAAEHIARYKLPKAFVFVNEISRSPSGKADYRWAKQIAIDAQQ
ncbi:MAG: acyl-CoA synthetase [Ilumatobacteraceae bacterium]|nr:acyl-CoA synthetase [Ilumatobacteraceae bacterium]